MNIKEARTFLGRTLSKTKYAARNVRDLEFDIDIDYIMKIYEQQNGKCALTGWDLEFTRGGIYDNGTNPRAATIDRIWNSSGYIRGNIQITCWQPNKVKGSLSNKKFIEMCNDITNVSNNKYSYEANIK
jgi:hypothetical protein